MQADKPINDSGGRQTAAAHEEATMEDATLSREDGRTLHFYDCGPREGWPVFWLHGTPNIGPPPEPLFTDAGRLGLRWLGYDRPGYGAPAHSPGGRWPLPPSPVAVG